ncbi:MAG: patatin-like phospholipase family protein [Scytonema hyalinum WJT4-NPBG1]|jgi:NTE family protein|nr:patatin-like phospholipase family protein [Scytonema hyalinum WJT4-NPBG1]
MKTKNEYSAPMTTKPYRVGLVLSGGGARGAYHVGVIKYLADMNIPIHAVAGASIGALNGAVVAAAPNLDTASKSLQEIWYSLADNSPIKINSTKTIEYIGKILLGQVAPLIAGTSDALSAVANLQTLLSENVGLGDKSPIHTLLDRYLDLEELQKGLPLYVSVYRSQGSLNDLFSAILASVNLINTRHSEFLHIQKLEQTQQRVAILASAAIPLLFKAEQIEVNETNYFYSDGGQGGVRNVQGNTPITPLLELANCTHIIVNHLSDGSLWDRNAFSKAFPNTTVLEIRPGRVIKRQGLVKDLIGFDDKNIQSWIEQGYEDTQRCCKSVVDALHIHEIVNQARKQRDEAIDELDNDNFHID